LVAQRLEVALLGAGHRLVAGDPLLWILLEVRPGELVVDGREVRLLLVWLLVCHAAHLTERLFVQNP